MLYMIGKKRYLAYLQVVIDRNTSKWWIFSLAPSISWYQSSYIDFILLYFIGNAHCPAKVTGCDSLLGK